MKFFGKFFVEFCVKCYRKALWPVGLKGFDRQKKPPMRSILIIHGPNLNLLGEREPSVYGTRSLKAINAEIRTFARLHSLSVKIFQSNHEGEIIDEIHRYRKWAQGMVINPGAYTHYSYAIRDAIAAVGLPTVEVHVSKIEEREAFRRVSVIKEVCVGQISGLGWRSYQEGIRILEQRWRGDHGRVYGGVPVG